MPVDQDPTIRVGIDADFHVAIATATANPLFPRLVSELRSVLLGTGRCARLTIRSWNVGS